VARLAFEQKLFSASSFFSAEGAVPRQLKIIDRRRHLWYLGGKSGAQWLGGRAFISALLRGYRRRRH